MTSSSAKKKSRNMSKDQHQGVMRISHNKVVWIYGDGISHEDKKQDHLSDNQIWKDLMYTQEISPKESLIKWRSMCLHLVKGSIKPDRSHTRTSDLY
jgi:hypothetical protein